MKYLSKENAIPKSYQDDIEELVFSRNFPWQVVHEEYSNGEDFALSLSHMALDDGPELPRGTTASDVASLLIPLTFTLEEILNKKIKKLLRIRIGFLQPILKSKQKFDFLDYVYAGDEAHIDFRIPHYTALYYINNSDGDTVVYNETLTSSRPDTFTELTRSTPEKGKVFIFNGDHYHASTRPKESYARAVIAYSFILEE
jgi:hypothetical protein